MRSRASAILAYHSLDESGSVISVSPSMFRQQMQSIADSGIPVVPLPQILDSPGSIAITFDDGYRNFMEHALPALSEFSLPATVFIVTGLCGRTNEWDQQGLSIPTLQLMTWEEVKFAHSAGVQFGAHTHTHEMLNAHNALEQMRCSRLELEDRLGECSLFAYPYGHMDQQVKQLAGQEFRYSCSMELKYVYPGDDKTSLPRIDAYYLPRKIPALMADLGHLYIGARRHLRALRTWLLR